jgi:hypothetical protein
MGARECHVGVWLGGEGIEWARLRMDSKVKGMAERMVEFVRGFLLTSARQLCRWFYIVSDRVQKIVYLCVVQVDLIKIRMHT